MVAAAPNFLGAAATVGVDGQLCIWEVPKHNGLPASSPRTVDVGTLLSSENMNSDISNIINEPLPEPMTVMLHSVSWSTNGEYVIVCGERGTEGEGLLLLWSTSAATSSSTAANNEVNKSNSYVNRSSIKKQSISTRLKMSTRVALLLGRKKSATSEEDEHASNLDVANATNTDSDDGLKQGASLDNKRQLMDWWTSPPVALDRQIAGPNAAFYCVAFSSTSTMLASGGAAPSLTALKRGAYGQVILWQTSPEGNGWKQLLVLGHGDKDGKHLLPSAVRAIAFAPSGRRIATSSGREGAASVGDNVVRVWDIAQKKVSLTIPLEAETGGAVGLDFSPSGRGLAIACANGDVCVVSVHSGGNDDNQSNGTARPQSQGSVLMRFKGVHAGGATGVKFGPNGAYLFSIGIDGRVLAWSVASAAPAAAFPMMAGTDFGAGMGPIAVTPDGYGVIAGDACGAPYMLQLEVARERAQKEGGYEQKTNIA